MANDGLMSIATNPELSTIEKFLLGGLVGAQETQKQTYKREQEMTDAAMKQATDRITKAKAKEKEISTKHKGLFSKIYTAAGNTPAEVAKTLVTQGPDAVDKFVKMAEADFKQSRLSGTLKGVGKFVTAKGETINLGPDIYRTPESAPDVARLSASLISAPTGKLPRTVSQTTFGEAVGQFFGMPRDRGELRRIAQERAASLTGYGSDIPMDEVDARSLYYAAGGEPKVREQTGTVSLREPFAKDPDVVRPAAESFQIWEMAARDEAGKKPVFDKKDKPILSQEQINASKKLISVLDKYDNIPPGGLIHPPTGKVVLTKSLRDTIIEDLYTLIGQGEATAFRNKYRTFLAGQSPEFYNLFDELVVSYGRSAKIPEQFLQRFMATQMRR